MRKSLERCETHAYQETARGGVLLLPSEGSPCPEAIPDSCPSEVIGMERARLRSSRPSAATRRKKVELLGFDPLADWRCPA
jgi:hypothetical protein